MGTADVVMVAVVTGLVCAGAGLWVGLWAKSLPRYYSPQIHEGTWRPVSPSQVGGTWLRDGRQPLGAATPRKGHRHLAQKCVIMPGLAHVDTCHCGAKRYGVFGDWQEKVEVKA
jgi:hypothetical protein